MLQRGNCAFLDLYCSGNSCIRAASLQKPSKNTYQCIFSSRYRPPTNRLNQCACVAGEKLGTCAGSPQHFLRLFSFLLPLPLSFLSLLGYAHPPKEQPKTRRWPTYPSTPTPQSGCVRDREVLCSIQSRVRMSHPSPAQSLQGFPTALQLKLKLLSQASAGPC